MQDVGPSGSGLDTPDTTSFSTVNGDPLSCRFYFQSASAHLHCDFPSDPEDID